MFHDVGWLGNLRAYGMLVGKTFEQRVNQKRLFQIQDVNLSTRVIMIPYLKIFEIEL